MLWCQRTVGAGCRRGLWAQAVGRRRTAAVVCVETERKQGERGRPAEEEEHGKRDNLRDSSQRKKREGARERLGFKPADRGARL